MSLVTLFKEMVKAKSSIQERLNELDKDIALHEHQHNATAMAAPARSDVEAMLHKWVADATAEFHRTFAERLKPFVRSARSLEDPRQIARLITLVGVPEDQQARAIDCVLCASQGPALGAAMNKALDMQEWSDTPVSLADKARKLEQLSQRLEDLRRELVDQAEDAGISLR